MKISSVSLLLAICTLLLNASASAAQQLPYKGASTDEILGVTPWQELKLKIVVSVSMYELIVNGGKYDNQYVQVQGFLRYKIDNGAVTANELYSDRDSLDYGVIENSIGVFDVLPDCDPIRLEDLDGEFLLMSGVFRATPGRHTLTPVDHIRLIKLDEDARERVASEILCKDDSLVERQLPYAPDKH